MLRLALALGKSVREIEDLDARELAEWLAYDRIEGIPQPWRQAGTIAAAVTNPWRKPGSKPLTPEVFMPIAKARPRQTSGQMFKALAAAWGGPKLGG